MFQRPRELSAVEAIYIVVCGLGVLTLSVGLPVWLATAIFVAFLIWFFARWLNRRDDPHHAKLPPDAP